MGCALPYQMIPGARTPTLCMQVQAVRAVHAVHQMTSRPPFLLRVTCGGLFFSQCQASDAVHALHAVPAVPAVHAM